MGIHMQVWGLLKVLESTMERSRVSKCLNSPDCHYNKYFVCTKVLSPIVFVCSVYSLQTGVPAIVLGTHGYRVHHPWKERIGSVVTNK